MIDKLASKITSYRKDNSCACSGCTKGMQDRPKTQPKKATQKYLGKVSWYNRHLGYGFINLYGGNIFFHHSVVNIPGFTKKTKIKKGTRVEIMYKTHVLISNDGEGAKKSLEVGRATKVSLL